VRCSVRFAGLATGLVMRLEPAAGARVGVLIKAMVPSARWRGCRPALAMSFNQDRSGTA
jgi:hypothetical protein